MYRFLREPKWIAVMLMLPIVILAFLELSNWQWGRYEDKQQTNDLVAAQQALPAEPAQKLIPVGSEVTDVQQWRNVTATGVFDASAQVLVRKRPLSEQMGFWVVTPLITPDAVVVVNRGWIPAAETSLTAPVVPAPPAGQVTIEGKVQASEIGPDAEAADTPRGQVTKLDVTKIAAPIGKPVLPGYVNLTSSDPAQPAGFTEIPLPPKDTGNHMSYSMQWIAFSIMAVVGVIVLIRREARFRAENAAENGSETSEEPPKRKPKRAEKETWDDEIYLDTRIPAGEDRVKQD